MRLNRKWLYLGGLITMLTLLLTLTWVLPAGAVGQLDDGTLSTERSAVNPSPDTDANEVVDANLTKVTLANDALDKTSTVVLDGDFGPIVLTVKSPGITVVNNRVIRVDIEAGTSNNFVDLSLGDGAGAITAIDGKWGAADIQTVLPITSDVTIDQSSGATDTTVANAIDSIFVINVVDGIIEFTLNDDLDTGDEIYLSYTTSPQETALVNVAGDSGNFDLLAVEGKDTPSLYAATFTTAEFVELDTKTDNIHEQHAVPSGLRGYIDIEEESITDRYANPDLTGDPHAPGKEGQPRKNIVPVSGKTDAQFYVQVANPPIRSRTNHAADALGTKVAGTDADVTAEGDIAVVSIAPVAGIVGLRVEVDGQLRPNDDVELNYVGSDDFFIEVNHGPVQELSRKSLLNATNSANKHFVVPSGTDDELDAENVFRVISLGDGVDTGCVECRVRIGIVGAPSGDDNDEPRALSSRISVLGIIYKGSERVTIPASEARAQAQTITQLLDFAPVDADDGDDIVTYDVAILAAGSDEIPASRTTDTWVVVEDPSDDTKVKLKKNDEATLLPLTPKVGNKITLTLSKAARNDDGDKTIVASFITVNSGGKLTETVELKNEGLEVVVTIGIVALALDDKITVEYRDSVVGTVTLGPNDLKIGTTSKDVDGRTVTITIPATLAVADNAYVDVTYTRRVGSNPQNALLPDEEARPIIAVSPGSRATITSGNDRVTVDAEVDGPTYTNAAPGAGAGVASPTATLSVDVNDEVSGVNMESIQLHVKVGNAPQHNVANDDLTITASGAGYSASIDLDDVKTGTGKETLSIDATKETAIEWWASAEDIAGNYSRSDAASKDGDQNYMFQVDGVNAEIDDVYTGDWFDEAETRVEGDRRITVGEYLPGASDVTSIRVVFSEIMDGTTIGATDFTVDGTAPLDAIWYGTGDTGSADTIGQSVFLSVAPMAANVTPTVAIVGSVSDKAGNATTTGSKEAQDGIAPTATVTVDKGLSDKKVQVTVNTDERIRTLTPEVNLYIADALDTGIPALDEVDVFTVGHEDPDDSGTQLVLRDANDNIVERGLPTATSKTADIKLTLSSAPVLDRSGDGTVDTGDVTVTDSGTFTHTVETDALKAKSGEITVGLDGVPEDGDTITVRYRGTDPDPATAVGVSRPAGKQVSPTSWTFDISITRNDRYAVTATVEDSNRNRGMGGSMDASAASATVFEIDNELAGGENPSTGDITHDPSGNRPVSTSEPFFIELTWDGERGEYPGDTSSRITLTKAMLDGEDVLTDAVRQNNQSYRISITGIALGAHTLAYNAEDDLGNAHLTDRVLKFTVQAVPTWDLGLSAGMNLISLPSSPANGDINEVFGATEQIDLIYTFEGTRSMVAVRNQDTGDFVGTLNTIDAKHAYWVSVSNAVTVPISIPQTSQLVAPPYLGVIGGQWNLVPVLSLGKVEDDADGVGAAPGTRVDADVYLGDFRTAFGWTGKGWNKIDPDADTLDTRLTNFRDDGVLAVGKGYWVLYDQNGSITP